MKRKVSFLVVFIWLTSIFSVRADEGMWLLNMLEKMNMDRMQEMGLKLSAEDIYNINQSSVKDAVVNFGGFCTGEIVSDQGLIFTNHHCGYGAIQEHSTTENNYLKEGFWAQSKDEEIPIDGLFVSFLVKMEDVTERVVSELDDDMTEEERAQKISEVSAQIEDEATEDTHYNANVKSFYNGNQFYLMIYERYDDVRMVGAPRESIGKFGHDTDNWVWPRHTGDFAIFRVYSSPDGEPAEYSEENVPLEPKHHFPISIKGVEKEDFSMILGYPGGTNRYMTSYGVEETMNITNPTRIKVREKKQEIMKEAMDASEELRIKYASKFSSSSNYYKYSIGQNEGLKRLKVMEEKKKLEDKFRDWVDAKPERKEKYGEALSLISEAYEDRESYFHTYMYMSEALFQGAEIIPFSSRFMGLYQTLKQNPDSTEAIDAEVENIKGRMEDFYKDYHAPTDKRIMAALFEIFYKNVKEDHHPELFSEIEELYNGDFEKYADEMFSNSMFTSMDRVNNFLEDPDAEVLESDPAFNAMQSIQGKIKEIGNQYRSFEEQLGKGQRLFLAGLMDMKEDKDFYPDANFTMRLTYGKIDDYYPRDAVHYDYYTTLKGVMEKEDPADEEFIVPAKLKELYKKKDYGRYGKDGEMRVCFISNNDITGGNSGSPVLNAKGELTGIAFDGNWEAMSGDIKFEPELQRTISVDIRYVLFVIDKFAGAKHLIEEMDIVE
ncbi:MAG: S46 family peptidase [Bacteroidales bacterium]